MEYVEYKGNSAYDEDQEDQSLTEANDALRSGGSWLRSLRDKGFGSFGGSDRWFPMALVRAEESIWKKLEEPASSLRIPHCYIIDEEKLKTTRQGRGDHLAVERIMALQVAHGQLPYPLLAPRPQPANVFATRLVFEQAPQSTGGTVTFEQASEPSIIRSPGTPSTTTSTPSVACTFTLSAPTPTDSSSWKAAPA
jgi:hypothetical protein